MAIQNTLDYILNSFGVIESLRKFCYAYIFNLINSFFFSVSAVHFFGFSAFFSFFFARGPHMLSIFMADREHGEIKAIFPHIV